MDTTTLICLAIIIFCVPISFYLFYYSYRNLSSKQNDEIIDQKPQPNNIEQRIRMESSHEINIIEEPNNILVIPIRIKHKQSSRRKKIVAKS